jgi:hypothetical protein
MKRELILFLAALAAPAAAQTPSDPELYDRALAAGYKAQFLCSGLWNGARTRDEVERDELSGIYDRIAAIVPTLPVEIDEERDQVRVPFTDAMPPRVAQWRDGLGCAALPIGAPPEAGASVPAFDTTNGLQTWDGRPWPMGDEGAEAPAPQRRAGLDRVAARAFADAAFGGRTSAVVVMHRGHIIAERYGLLRTEEAANLAAWRASGDPRAAITVDQLMRMASGLTSDTAGNRTDDLYIGGTAVADRSPRWPLLHPPGSRFRYANNDTLLATMALIERVPENEQLGYPLNFFRRLGMTRTIAETDWQGNFILSSQVWTTARDLARLGLLYLQDGMWEGERLLPEGWREYVTRASGPQPEGEFGYGATFWLMNRSEGVPADTFAAFGNRGQYLVIVPSRDLVIVRRGYDTSEERFDVAAFTRAVVAALE